MPTLNESAVPGYIVTGFHLLLVPSATPSDIVSKLNAETLKTLGLPQVKERLATLGLEPARWFIGRMRETYSDRHRAVGAGGKGRRTR